MIIDTSSAQPTMSLIEELKLKEQTTANNMLFHFLNERCQQLNNNSVFSFPVQSQQVNEIVGKSVSPLITPNELASPVPLSPLEFNNNAVNNNQTTVLSSTASSPISSPSTSSVDSGLDSEDDRRPHQCPDCLKRFRFKSNLFEHKTLHQHATPFVCPFCSKTCRLKGNLKKHLQVHVSSSEALEELWKSRFSRSSGRPRKQVPNANQQPSSNLHRQQLPTPMATYAPTNPMSTSPVMVSPPAIDFRQALFDLNSLLTLNANQQQLLSTAFNRL
jgi:hypothetical protein